MSRKVKTGGRGVVGVGGVLVVLAGALVGALAVAATLALALPAAASAEAVPKPYTRDDSVITDRDVPVTFRVLDNDTGYYLRVTYTGKPEHGTVVCPEDGACTYTPDAEHQGADGFSYVVTDSAGQRSAAFVDVFTRASGGDPDAGKPPSGGGEAADKTPPTGSIRISRSAEAGSRAVVLTLSAEDTGTGVKSMRLANENAAWGAWEPFAETRTWRLSRDKGLKTVRVQFQDGAGNASPSYSRTVRIGKAG